MSGYSPRRAPNVSQYIANLNTIPSAQDLAAQQTESYRLDDDLAIFTNAEFFDFDIGASIDQSSAGFDAPQHEQSRRGSGTRKTEGGVKALNFDNDFQFSGLPYVSPDANASLPPPVQTNYSSTFDLANYASPSSQYNVSQQPDTGDKRSYSATSMSPASPSFEASSRAAAEEDKRRRNTAASARFRVKKKQREQALEKTAKEMTDRADALEARITQLEMENKWLRNIVTEKTSKGKEDMAELWKRFTAENEGRSMDLKKRGVGTVSKEGFEQEED